MKRSNFRIHSAIAQSCCLLVLFATGAVRVAAQAPTTLNDFFLLGTQPDNSDGVDFTPILHSSNCRDCHEIYDPIEVPIYTRWSASMMANAARDPLFQAALTIANQDAAFAGDLCLRCHTPGAWLAGRSVPTDGSALLDNDFDAITCNFCHRMVDPVFQTGVSPPEDEPIVTALANAGLLPTQYSGGSYVVQAEDVRRGPFDDVPANYHGVPIIPSPFHTSADICGTCHDVSNPAFTRQPDGSYALNELDAEHPTLDKYDMFPVERTFSEWANSTYATVGVDANGVFGGNHATGIMRTCQDCHMPDTKAYGSAFDEAPFFQRNDVPSHDFTGGNTWIQDAIDNLYPFTVLPWYLDESKDRARYMLEHAATLEMFAEGCDVRVRVTNETGHKLPTGYPEGRRMWISVTFLDDSLSVVAEHGAYNAVEADLVTHNTKVYEAQLGVDSAMAKITGLTEGPTFHFAVNNKIYKDNRIPPRGFTNEAFAAVQAAPIGVTYSDGQYWSDTRFRIPPGASGIEVRLYYQTASKEYITFLRDENDSNETGNVLYEQWELTGKSPPVLMQELTMFELTPGLFGDIDCNETVDLNDYRLIGDCVSGVNRTLSLGCEGIDVDGDADVDLLDVAALQRAFTLP